MNYQRLEKNLTDMIKEAQLKLGYDKREITLNYAESSLKALLGADLSAEQTGGALAEFAAQNNDKFGEISYEYKEEEKIFALTVSEKGSEYVHRINEGYEFLAELISEVSKHNCTARSITEIFKKYSDKVHIQKSDSEEFDLLIYFEDGEPDEYYYCISDHDLHVSYHRFIKEDYVSFGF